MPIDRDALASAFNQLKSRPVPWPPRRSGPYRVGSRAHGTRRAHRGPSRDSAGSGRPQATSLHEATDHARRLGEISVVGNDEQIYEACVSYVKALQEVEGALGGRRSTTG